MIDTETIQCAVIIGAMSAGACFAIQSAGMDVPVHVNTFVCATAGALAYKTFYKRA